MRNPAAIAMILGLAWAGMVVETSPQESGQPGPDIATLQAADEDTLGLQVLAGDGDPSFEALARLAPAMKRPREALGVKNHPHDFGVTADGTIEISDDVDADGAFRAFFEFGPPAVRFGSGPQGCRKSLAESGMPIVRLVYEQGRMLFQQTIFGWSEDMSPDEEAWVYVRLVIQNLTAAAVQKEVRLRIFEGRKEWSYIRWTLNVPAAGQNELYVKIPFHPNKYKPDETEKAEFEKRRTEVKDFWSRFQSQGMQVELPEKRVHDAWRTWLAYASLDVDTVNGRLEPHDGAGFYEQVYGYSAAVYANALDLWGRHDDARRTLESLLSFQQPDGLFYMNFGTPDSGALLMALAAHYRFTRDVGWLRSVAARVVKMADAILKKRAESMVLDEGGPKPATFGLIRFRPYCDHADPAFDYFGDTYCCVGIEEAAEALADAGLKAEAERLAREAALYRQDILASMDASTIERDGRKILPMEPDTHRLLKSTNYRGGGYYGLIASCMLENGFLAATDSRAQLVARLMEDKGGLRLGLCEFDGGVDHAYTYGYWLQKLALDDVRRVILGLYASLAFGMSRETYSGVEVTKLFTGENEPTLPHLYSCTQQLRLLRMMLVREEGEDLWLGQAVPRSWLEKGNMVVIRHAPTSFGPVTLAMSSYVDKGQIAVRLDPPTRKPPGTIHLRLRHPQGRPLARVKMNGTSIDTFSADTIRLSSLKEPVYVLAEYD